MNDDVNVQADKEFLGKLQTVLQLLNDIDDIISVNAENQSNACKWVSDFEHVLQNCDDVESVDSKEFVKRFQKYRLQRASYNNIFALSNVWKNGKNKILGKEARMTLYNDICQTWINLNQPYEFRCMDNKMIEILVKPNERNSRKKDKKESKCAISKNELIDCINAGMRGIEIANKYNMSQSTLIYYKKKYGIKTRKYEK